MQVKCPECTTSYIIAEHKVPAAGGYARCQRCRARIRVKKSGDVPIDPEGELRAQVRALGRSTGKAVTPDSEQAGEASAGLPRACTSGGKLSPSAPGDGTAAEKSVPRRFDSASVFGAAATPESSRADPQPGSGLTRRLKLLLVGNAVLFAAGIWMDWMEASLCEAALSGMRQWPYPGRGWTQLILESTQWGLFLVTVGVFLKWVYRANRTARQLGAQGMKFSPSWCVGCYFVPILNLWRPYQAMREIWKASLNPRHWAVQTGGTVVALWWILWILSIPLGCVALGASMKARSLGEIMVASRLSLTSEVVCVLLCIAAILLVSRISRMQRDRLRTESIP